MIWLIFQMFAEPLLEATRVVKPRTSFLARLRWTVRLAPVHVVQVSDADYTTSEAVSCMRLLPASSLVAL